MVGLAVEKLGCTPEELMERLDAYDDPLGQLTEMMAYYELEHRSSAPPIEDQPGAFTGAEPNEEA